MNDVKEFFQECEEEMQQRDYINELSKLVKTDSDENVFAQALKRWLVASVANIYEDGNTNPVCLVLCGGQGFSKSYFFEHLTPPNSSFMGHLALKEKDALVLLTDTFLVVLDEQFSLLSKKSEWQDLKRLITMSEVKVRKPYKKAAMTYKRIANFCGTSNLSKDEITNLGRRILAFNLTSPINVEELKKIPVSKIWGQAYILYKQGFLTQQPTK